MVAVFPTGVKVQGKIKLNWVPAVAAYTTAITLTEINVAGGIDLSCYLTSEGWNPSIDQTKGTTPRRLCTTVEFEQFGNTTYSVDDLSYVVDPQGAAASNGRLAYEKLVPGTAGFFVERLGLDAVTVNWATTQFVSIWPTTLGERLTMGDPSDEFAEFMVTQSVIVTAPRNERVAITT